MAIKTRYRLTRLLAIALAIVGVVFLVDATMRGGLLRYQLFGWAVGGLLLLPVGVAVVFREPGLRLLSRCAFACLVALLSVLVLEPVLRLTGIGEVVEVKIVADERLGHKLPPGLGGIDANGFRNPRVPERVDVLFLGDSQTYGFGVTRDESFPHAFGAAARRTVYSMGMGGYGPVQYRELARQGLSMQPKILVVAFYFGNDARDAFDHAHLSSASDLRQQGIQYPTEGSVPSLKGNPTPNLAIGTLEGIAGISRFVSMTLSVARSQMRDLGGVWADEPGTPRWSGGGIATLFSPELRLAVVDLENPEVAQGVRITVQCLRDIAARCQRAGTRCVLLPLHTKEFCYRTLAAGMGKRLELLDAQHAAETRTTEVICDAASAAGFELLDPTHALVTGLAADRALWPHGSDGHLNVAGHAVIATLLAEKLGPR